VDGEVAREGGQAFAIGGKQGGARGVEGPFLELRARENGLVGWEQLLVRRRV
jgi:hypothetical protein